MTIVQPSQIFKPATATFGYVDVKTPSLPFLGLHEGVATTIAQAAENTTRLQLILDNAKAMGGQRVLFPRGHYRFNGQVNLPSFTVNGWTSNPPTFAEENPLWIEGAGKGLTTVEFLHGGSFGWAHATITSTSIRAQNFHPHIEGISFVGPKSWTAPLTALLGIDNSRSSMIRDCSFEGNPSTTEDKGFGVLIRGYSRGGSYGTTFENCRFGEQKDYVTKPTNLASGAAVGTSKALLARTLRWGVVLDGPALQVPTGKVNDTSFNKCRFNDMLIGSVRMKGVDGTGTFEGGTYNTSFDNNFAVHNLTKNMKEGLLVAGSTTTVIALETPAANWFGEVEADFIDRQIAIETAPGVWVHRWIVGVPDLANKRFEIDAPLDAAPAEGVAYKISYGDTAAKTFLAAGDFPCHVFYDSKGGLNMRAEYIEEKWRTVVASNRADDNVCMWACRDTVSNGHYSKRAPQIIGATSATPTTVTLGAGATTADGSYITLFVRSGAGAGQSRGVVGYDGATTTVTVSSPWTVQPDATSVIEMTRPWAPAVYDNVQPHAADGVEVSSIRRNILLSNPQTLVGYNDPASILRLGRNGCTGTVTTGDVVRLSTNESSVVDANAASYGLHAVVYAEGAKQVFGRGELVMWVLEGVAKVRVAGVVSPGDLIVPQNGLAAIAVPRATANPDQVSRSIGSAIGASVVVTDKLVLCRLGAQPATSFGWERLADFDINTSISYAQHVFPSNTYNGMRVEFMDLEPAQANVSLVANLLNGPTSRMALTAGAGALQLNQLATGVADFRFGTAAITQIMGEIKGFVNGATSLAVAPTGALSPSTVDRVRLGYSAGNVAGGNGRVVIWGQRA